MPQRYTLNDIPHIVNKSIFFDANIIIYLFWPIYDKYDNSKKYASFFKALVHQKNTCVINITVLSEVINRIIRLEQYNLNLQSERFKDFRNSPEGTKVQKDIFSIVENTILKVFTLTDQSLSIDDVIKYLQTDTLDFNDKIIADICKKNGMILLTNDADFSAADIDILSANTKLCTTQSQKNKAKVSG